MVLDHKCVSYNHQQRSGTAKLNTDAAIPLSDIVQVILIDAKQNGVGCFEIVTTTKKIRFQCNSDEALLWVRDIQNIKLFPPGCNEKHSLYEEIPLVQTQRGSAVKMFHSLKKNLLNINNESRTISTSNETFTYEQAFALEKYVTCNKLTCTLIGREYKWIIIKMDYDGWI
jgi:hypothetical protein